jgi:mannose-1-phosphate guanylyltransferase
MKAIFLAGGKGSRLRPLTDKVPKPMVPIMNKPLIERTMVHLKTSGINQIVMSSCYRFQDIEDYFGNGEKLGLEIEYIVEDKPMGTGGAIRKAGTGVDKTFIVFNSDILSDLNIKKMLEFHKKSKAIATIAVTKVENPSAYGVIACDKKGYAKSFIEKPEPNEDASHYVNAGIYIFEPGILDEIPQNKVISVERDIFPKLLDKGLKIAVFRDDSYWIDIGTIKKYLQTHKDIMHGKCKLVGHRFNSQRIVVGKNVKIHPEAKIIGPVYIGNNVKISGKSTINGSVIGNNVTIGEGNRIVGSVLWDNINLGSDIKLYNTVLTTGDEKEIRKRNCK